MDLGERRIGLAATDETQTLASPLSTIERTGDATRDHLAIVEAAREIGAEKIVVGLPLSLSGREGPAAQSVQREVDELRRVSEPGITVHTHDERFTTMTAERSLRESGKRSRARRKSIDAAAAAVMLQAWLDGNRA